MLAHGGVAIEQGDVRPLGGKGAGDGPTDALGRAGDNGGLSFEVEVHEAILHDAAKRGCRIHRCLEYNTERGAGRHWAFVRGGRET